MLIFNPSQCDGWSGTITTLLNLSHLHADDALQLAVGEGLLAPFQQLQPPDQSVQLRQFQLTTVQL